MRVNITKTTRECKLRFTVDGQRFSLGTAGASKSVVCQVAALIESDIASASFDHTLQRYRARLTGKGTLPKTEFNSRVKLKNILDGWDMWVESLALPQKTVEGHYNATRSFLEKCAVNGLHSAAWLESHRDGLSAFTFNLRRRQLKNCVDWLRSEGLWSHPNPYQRVKLKSSKGKASTAKPFTEQEVKLIIDAIESDRFTPEKSAFKHSHYGPYVRFLFATGCRTGEAVGLTVGQLDLDKGRVWVGSSLSKHRGRRIRTAGKTGESGWLPLPDSLVVKLRSLTQKNSTQGGYVFTGPKGRGYLNPDNFRNRVWKPVLEGLGLAYRPPYQCRHTLLSAIAKTGDLPLAARVARHKNLRMVTEHYAGHAGEVTVPNLID